MEPESELERQVQAVWQEVLAQDAISVTSDFFHLGGTSLRVWPAAHSLQTCWLIVLASTCMRSDHPLQAWV